MATLELHTISKSFKSVQALKNINLTVHDGEFLALLGPSGSGKTTVLRIIAGLEMPTTGDVFIDNRLITKDPPWHRDCGFVFNTYALFPQLSVRENIGYGLRLRKFSREIYKREINNIAEKLQILDLLDRFPSQLSAGQQQRVALARALAIKPTVLLMDEPLANLDARLRRHVRYEIKMLQEDLGITTIYVTHDQEEAFAMGDTVAVMNSGRIEQMGTPYELYTQPKTSFVGVFIGNNNNVVQGKVSENRGDWVVVNMGPWALRSMRFSPQISINDDVTVVIRPEDIKVTEPEINGPNIMTGEIMTQTFLGSSLRLLLDVGFEIEVLIHGEHQGQFDVGQQLSVMVEDSLVFPRTS